MHEGEGLDRDRVVAFSDGVFAVAITLLVLNLKVPFTNGHVDPLRAMLHTEWPAYAIFVLSFAIVGIKWMNHHRMFSQIDRVNTTLVILNLVLLLGVTLVPFTTAVLGDYLGTPDQALASLLYGVVWVLNGIAYTALWYYAQWRGLTSVDPTSIPARQRTILYALGPFGYALGAVVSFANVYAAIVIYAVVVSVYVFPPPRLSRH